MHKISSSLNESITHDKFSMRDLWYDAETSHKVSQSTFLCALSILSTSSKNTRLTRLLLSAMNQS